MRRAAGILAMAFLAFLTWSGLLLLLCWRKLTEPFRLWQMRRLIHAADNRKP